MCKVLVTCYIPLLLVIAANGKPFTSPNGTPFTSPNEEYLKCAIDDVIELEKMTKNIDYDGFYTPEDFSNEEHRMEALGFYMAEMNTLKEESEGDVMVNNSIDRIMKCLGVSVSKESSHEQRFPGLDSKYLTLQSLMLNIRDAMQQDLVKLPSAKSHYD
ncbi:unnamed protein product [Caretta caretta]